MDLNSGYVKDADALINLHKKGKHHTLFKKEQYETYKTVIERIRLRIMDEFELENLYFTGNHLLFTGGISIL